MTFQEAIDQGRRIVFHGHEPGYWLVSYDDEQEVRRIPNREYKAVFDRLRTPEQIERDRRDEETTRMVNAELRRRARNCVTDIGTYIMIECALMLGMVLSVHCGYMNSLYVFCPAMAVVAVLIWNRHREFYKIHAFFRWRREQEMEWE